MKLGSLALGLAFLCSTAASAQMASGSFRFETKDGTQTVEFSARTDRGQASGGLAYSGSIDTPVIDVDGDGNRECGKYGDWSLKVDVDCLVVNGNRASLSGLIRDATQREIIGRRVILAVEDNAQGEKEPDRFTFGVYRNDKMDWIPADSELRFDEGWSLTWEATDAERKDDVPIPGRPQAFTDCNSFPLNSYALDDLKEGAGDIIVSSR